MRGDLFIVALEIIFLSIKENKNIRRVDICNHAVLYRGYVDDFIFFLNDELSLIEMMEVFDEFFLWRTLAGTVVLKEVKMALCGMESISLT